MKFKNIHMNNKKDNDIRGFKILLDELGATVNEVEQQGMYKVLKKAVKDFGKVIGQITDSDGNITGMALFARVTEQDKDDSKFVKYDVAVTQFMSGIYNRQLLATLLLNNALFTQTVIAALNTIRVNNNMESFDEVVQYFCELFTTQLNKGNGSK